MSETDTNPSSPSKPPLPSPDLGDVVEPSAVLYRRYIAVMDVLMRLAEIEGFLLDRGENTITVVAQREPLSREYAALSATMQEHAAAYRAAGLLDPDEVEQRIRDLTALTKENQRRYADRTAANKRRVDAIMRVLSDTSMSNDNAVQPVLRLAAGRDSDVA